MNWFASAAPQAHEGAIIRPGGSLNHAASPDFKRRKTRPALGMLVQLRGNPLMGPARLLPAERAIALGSGVAGDSPRIGVLTGPGRGLRLAPPTPVNRWIERLVEDRRPYHETVLAPYRQTLQVPLQVRSAQH
jgi:hypothetical protein